MNLNRLFSGMFGLFFVLVLLNVGVGFGADSCTDTDGGNNIEEKGTMTAVISKAFYSLQDKCDPSNSFKPVGNQLIEYVCTSTGFKEIKTTCPGGMVCFDGACGVYPEFPTTCTDTDSLSTMEKGTVTAKYKNGTKITKTDSCNGNQITEYYCNEGTSNWDSMTVNCPTNYVCKEGKCEKEPTKCTDSDGKDLSTKGKTSGIVYTSGAYSSTSDSCASPTQVNEIYCEDNYVKWTMETCPNGYKCSDGACAPTVVECTDSDGGQILNKKGTVTTTKSGKPKTYMDSCSGNDKIVEYYCSNKGGVVSKVLKCPGTSTCVDGACINNTFVTPGSGSSCSYGVCPGTVYGTSGDSSGQLKKTNLREFLLSPGWRVDSVSLISGIFQSGVE